MDADYNNAGIVLAKLVSTSVWPTGQPNPHIQAFPAIYSPPVASLVLGTVRERDERLAMFRVLSPPRWLRYKVISVGFNTLEVYMCNTSGQSLTKLPIGVLF